MELESYYDGVSGWTGSGKQTTPVIAPGTSFIARMTPPRAGTFIYHTHWHDDVQLVNGLYGPLIVLAEGEKYDPEHDRIFLFSAGKYAPFGFMLLVNGHPEPDPVQLYTATRYRLRLINITQNEADLRVRLLNKGVPVRWKVIAKDGADLPPAQLKFSTADMGITVGETYDVEYRDGDSRPRRSGNSRDWFPDAGHAASHVFGSQVGVWFCPDTTNQRFSARARIVDEIRRFFQLLQKGTPKAVVGEMAILRRL